MLLSSLDHRDLQTWQQQVLTHVQQVVGADHAAFWMPEGETVSMATWQLPPDVAGFFSKSASAAMRGMHHDRLIEQSMQTRLYEGGGVYHERDLTRRETVEQSPIYQEILRPAGVCYTTGMSVPLPEGEAAICLAFERAEAEGFGEVGLQRLKLLLPSFEAGVIMRHRLRAQRRALLRMLDRLTDGLYISDADGAVLHRNTAFNRLLDEEPQEAALLGAVERLADALRRQRFNPNARTTAVLDTLPAASELETGGAHYRLAASYAPPELLGTRVVIVNVRRTKRRIPSPMRLARRYDLTPRQAQVAALVAQGDTNKEVAVQLGISVHTAKHHVTSVMRKMKVASRRSILLTVLRDE